LEAIGTALNQNGKVIVTGCMGAEPEQIRERFPNVLAITGPQAYESVMAAVHQAAPPRMIRFSIWCRTGRQADAAPLRLSEDFRGLQQPLHLLHHPEAARRSGLPPGRRCAARGRKAGEGRREGTAGHLAGHLGLWRRPEIRTKACGDREVRTRFYDLAKELGSLGAWVRLHYVYPYPHVDEAIQLMADGVVLPYLDIPFQHAAPNVLKAMKRPAHQEKTLERIPQVARDLPGSGHPLDLHRRLPRRDRGGFPACCWTG
jgi:ribosomal protein S12 methylthiotransferase